MCTARIALVAILLTGLVGCFPEFARYGSPEEVAALGKASCRSEEASGMIEVLYSGEVEALRDVVRIEGSLHVSMSENSDSTSAIFPCLEEVTGGLLVDTGATTRVWFPRLERIGQDLYLGWNYDLTDLRGFEALDSVGTDLYVTCNPALTSIEDFDGLDVGGNVTVAGNSLVTDAYAAEFVDGLGTISGSVQVSDNGYGLPAYEAGLDPSDDPPEDDECVW